MSYKTWHDYGYGVCTSTLAEDASFERLLNLFQKAPMIHDRFLKAFEKDGIVAPTHKDYLEALEEHFSYGITDLLVEAIHEGEGIWFTATSDFDGETYLIYQPSYPWNLGREELSLTQDDIDKILEEYISILTDEPIAPDFQDIANGG